MRITKSMAEEIAAKMTAKFKEKTELRKKSLYEKIEEAIKKTVPQEVWDFYRKFPNHVKLTNYVCVYSDSNEYRLTTKNLSQNIPSKNSSAIRYTLTKEEYKEWVAIEKDEQKLKDLIKSLTQTLINLKNDNRAKQELPESAPFFEAYAKQAIPTTLVVQTNKLREELNYLNLP